MSTPEDPAPPGAALDDVSRQTGAAPAEAGPERIDDEAVELADGADPAASSHDALSPAVRRLVRQFDLDITGIHGTGPSGRIRVGDVMVLLGGRTDSGSREVPARIADPEGAADPADAANPPAEDDARPSAAPGAGGTARGPITTVFDCDLSCVLAHRKRLRGEGVELLTTSYFLTALAAALDAAPEIAAGGPPRLGVALTTAAGELRSAFLDVAAISSDTALDERVRAVDAALRASLDGDVAAATLLVHHYGESGSVLASPTPIAEGHRASVGIGAVRREVVVRSVNGIEAPRLAARCYVSLSFFGDEISLSRANRALAAAVRTLEDWPDDS